MNMIPADCCQCGCGQKTSIAPYNSASRGWTKGNPLRFIRGHNSRGNNNPSWNGGVSKTSFGHKSIKTPNHHRANRHGYTPEHNLIAEKVLKKPLPPKSIVHHHTSNELVVCENQGYHCFGNYILNSRMVTS